MSFLHSLLLGTLDNGVFSFQRRFSSCFVDILTLEAVKKHSLDKKAKDIIKFTIDTRSTLALISMETV